MKNFFNSLAKRFRADPNAVGESGYTSLQQAVVENNLKKVKALLEAGADVNLRGSLIFPPLHFALDKDRQNIALALLQAGADVNLQDAEGQTPLHKAAAQGQESFIRALLKLGADPNVKDVEGRTPLHVVSTATPEIIAVLAQGGADLDAQTLEGDTPLHAFLEKAPMVEQLLHAGANPNVRNKKGCSAYMLLLDEDLGWKHQKSLQRMLEMNADLGTTNQLGETILHLAGRLEMTDAFNRAFDKAELSVRDANGNNVLHALVRKQNIVMIQRVLDKAPDLIDQKNVQGLTPLGELARRAGRTPASMTDKLMATARILILRGADPSARDNAGKTLLHHAVEQEQADFMHFLLERKINPDLADKDGRAPLHLAIDKAHERGSIALLDLLLDMGANPDLPDTRGWTVLDRLAEKGDRDSSVVQRLIVAGGQYKKQLPLNPDQMRKRATDAKGGLEKPVLGRKPQAFGKDGPNR